MSRAAPDQLAGVLGHELRNPVAAALTGALVARDLIDDDDPRAAVVDGVVRDLQRIAELTDGWLALARGQQPARGEVDLVAVLAAVAARHAAEIVAAPATAPVLGHAALLERLFDNLCENARRAGARRIAIHVARIGDEHVVHVDDDGAGIDAADVSCVFQPGWSKRGGAGLGLHAVAATAAAHRGAVRCEPLPRGARFAVTLPAADVAAARA